MYRQSILSTSHLIHKWSSSCPVWRGGRLEWAPKSEDVHWSSFRFEPQISLRRETRRGGGNMRILLIQLITERVLTKRREYEDEKYSQASLAFTLALCVVILSFFWSSNAGVLEWCRTSGSPQNLLGLLALLHFCRYRLFLENYTTICSDQ